MLKVIKSVMVTSPYVFIFFEVTDDTATERGFMYLLFKR